MKTKIYLGCFLAASLLAATTSCSGFLDEDPKGKMAPDNYFTCQADLDNSINTIYEKLNQTQSWTNPMYPQWQGDDMTANPGSNKQAVAALDGFSSEMVPTRVLQMPGISTMVLSRLATSFLKVQTKPLHLK